MNETQTATGPRTGTRSRTFSWSDPAVTAVRIGSRSGLDMLRAMGADVVGMSTVPEVIVAVHAGMRVLGISILTDRCLPDALQPASVEAIIAVAGRAEPQLTTLVRGVLERM